MNIVYIHRGGTSLGVVASAVAAQGCTLCVHAPPVSVDAIVAQAPAVLVVDASIAATHDLCHRLKRDARTAAVPLLVLAPPSSLSSRRWTTFADDTLELPLSADELAKRLRAWCTLQETWHRRLDTQASSTLLVLRRVASLARRARGVAGERLVDDAAAFGRFLGLSEEEQAALEDGARLHDFGDLTLPSADTDLADSFERYRPELSESLLAPVASPTLLEVIRHHSERWDGTGFPDGLEGRAIPRLARVMRLLVKFDEAVRAGLTRADALAALERDALAGGSDPDLHLAFVRWASRREDAHQVQP